MTSIPNVLSNKIKRVAFWLSIFVVVQHAISVPGLEYDKFTQLPANIRSIWLYFIDQQVLTIVNPIFFTLSGFLFFTSLTTHTIAQKIQKRLRTVGIPFIVISLMTIGFSYVLPVLLPSYTPYYALPKSVDQWLSSMLFTQIAYQLWFIRDLMVYILISPILYVSLTHASKLTLFLISLVWIANPTLSIISVDNVLFFPLGAWFALKNIDIHKKIPVSHIWFYACLWLVFMLCKLYLVFSHQGNEYVLVLFHRAALIAGGYTIWKIFDYVNDVKTFTPYYRYFFFVYLFHLPYLTVVQYLLTPHTSNLVLVDIFAFILSPAIVYITLVFGGIVLRTYLPRFYNSLTGNR